MTVLTIEQFMVHIASRPQPLAAVKQQVQLEERHHAEVWLGSLSEPDLETAIARLTRYQEALENLAMTMGQGLAELHRQRSRVQRASFVAGRYQDRS